MAKKMTLKDKPELKLFTGEEQEALLDGLVDNFLQSKLKPASKYGNNASRLAVIACFDEFIDHCRELSSGKVVMLDGKMVPVVSTS